jgi:hypothetical protein
MHLLHVQNRFQTTYFLTGTFWVYGNLQNPESHPRDHTTASDRLAQTDIELPSSYLYFFQLSWWIGVMMQSFCRIMSFWALLPQNQPVFKRGIYTIITKNNRVLKSRVIYDVKVLWFVRLKSNSGSCSLSPASQLWDVHRLELEVILEARTTKKNKKRGGWETQKNRQQESRVSAKFQGLSRSENKNKTGAAPSLPNHLFIYLFIYLFCFPFFSSPERENRTQTRPCL